MKDNMDRTLGIVCMATLVVCVVCLYIFWSASWPIWLLFALITFGLYTWAGSGLTKIEVGWEGQLLFLGERQEATMIEGLRWVPWPFSLKLADCRQVVIKLDTLKKIITKDNVQVEIDGTIIRKIVDLNKYFGVEESGIKQGLDDIWDETIRTRVADANLADVLKMHAELGKKAHNSMGRRASAQWGIKILRVVIAGIKPDSKVADDLALKERENLQREGQKVEFAHFIDRVKDLVAAGLTREQAIEQTQLALGKATKAIDAKTFALDEASAKIIESVFGRRS